MLRWFGISDLCGGRDYSFRLRADLHQHHLPTGIPNRVVLLHLTLGRLPDFGVVFLGYVLNRYLSINLQLDWIWVFGVFFLMVNFNQAIVWHISKNFPICFLSLRSNWLLNLGQD